MQFPSWQAYLTAAESLKSNWPFGFKLETVRLHQMVLLFRTSNIRNILLRKVLRLQRECIKINIIFVKIPEGGHI